MSTYLLLTNNKHFPRWQIGYLETPSPRQVKQRCSLLEYPNPLPLQVRHILSLETQSHESQDHKPAALLVTLPPQSSGHGYDSSLLQCSICWALKLLPLSAVSILITFFLHSGQLMYSVTNDPRSLMILHHNPCQLSPRRQDLQIPATGQIYRHYTRIPSFELSGLLWISFWQVCYL